ncbi:sushi, von Willebrand factor type A, EGF and pentraxin domain-containing protein 1-like [Sycon ciliatum]|uniref:sushi, von Willebrand factor type A, EGF and pentraxin domain-containing protein 1-like n=1 Tax=Sycon ciliatum TaxID=27933 RepID=UPI0031F5FEF7
MGHLRSYVLALLLISASWLKIDAQSYVVHFNCNNPQGLYYASATSWMGTPSGGAFGRCTSIGRSILQDSETSSTCFLNYLAHIDSALGTMNTVYTNLTGQVSCYPKTTPCPGSGPIVICSNTRTDASNAPTNAKCLQNLQFAYGTVSYPSGNVFPSQGFYTCNPGYFITGTRVAECGQDGSWGSATASCTAYKCPAPTLANGLITGCAPVYTASCNSGYQPSGSTTVTCMNATTNTPVPTCVLRTCPALISPTSGSIVSSSTSPYGVTIFACNDGYQLIGSSATVCMANGAWSTPLPTCKRIQCPANPTSPVNGAVSSGGGNAFAIRTYSCSTGYQLSGATTTVCQTTGAWSGTPPTCIRVLCSSQVAPLNGAIASMSMEINGATIFTCNSGYNLAGSSASVCLPSGNWSTSPPTCQGIQCPITVPTPANGAIVTGANDVFISRQYTCNSGYQLQGSSNTICLSTGAWSTPTPTCKRVECPILNAPTNGAISPGNSEVFTLRRFTCNTGFNLVGNSASVCLSGGTWSTVTPQCVGIQCSGPLANPTNGRVNTSTISVFSVSTYSCNSGYELVGETNSICLSTGQWSGPAPTCSSINCNALPSILNGNVQPGQAPLIRGSTAFVRCNEGFALSGMSTITCQSDLNWSTAPACSQIRCLAPLTPPMNGNISNGDNVFFSIREYSCSPGYELQGAKSTACQTNGNWSVSPPTCNEIICNSIPPTPNNGFLTTGVTTLGSILVFGCDAGFELVGTNGVTACQADKTWSLTSVTCSRRACPSPPNITNAVVMANPTKSYVYGDSVFVQCNTGHSGSGNINCTSAGTWTELMCSASNCGSLGDPVNGIVFMSGDTFDSTALYTCSAGYNLNGSSSATCTHSGMWSPPAPHCDRVNCGPLSNPTNGRVVAARTDFESTATYTCSVGFVLSGQSATNCLLNGSWSSPPPTCQPRPCPSPPTIHNGVVMSASSASYAYGDSVFVQCSMGHSGNGNITCLADGTWSMLNCSASVCGAVSKPANGGVFMTGTTYGATASFSCNIGYNLNGSSSINCPENGTWSATPRCDRVTCAVLMDPMYGTVRATGNDYLAKANYSCNPGYVLSGDAVSTCLLTGLWSSQPPICQPRPCPGPPNTNNGVVMSDPSASYAYGDSVYVQCNTGHSGNDNITCTADGTWSTLTCSASDCGAILEPVNGMFFTNGTTYGSMASFTCNIGYNLAGSSSITCPESGVWSASFPSCDRKFRDYCTNAESVAMTSPKFSKVYDELDDSSKCRYREKLERVAPDSSDPYLPRSIFLEEDKFPLVDYPDIYNFLVNAPSPYTKEQLKAYKSLEGYKYLVSGWVGDVRAFPASESDACDSKFIIAKVRHSHLYSRTQLIQNTGSTSLPCQWSTPSMKEVEYARIRDINFTAPDTKQHGSKPYVPSKPEGYPPILDLLYEPDMLDASFGDLLVRCEAVFPAVCVSEEEARAVEQATLNQADSKAWFEFRAGRITASKLKSAVCTDISQPSTSLVRSVCYPEAHKFRSKATQWGCDHEQKAIDNYSEHASATHQKVEVLPSGFVIHPDYPYRGATPDSLVQCSCCGNGVVEVKCPYGWRDSSLHDAADSGQFCLVKSGGALHLKQDHMYYYQVQLQMLVCKVQYCDFVVWNEGQLFVERICADTDFIREAVPGAQKFFQCAVLPELVGKWFTKTFSTLPADASSAATSASEPLGAASTTSTADQERPPEFCYCKSVKAGEVLRCSNNDCSIRLFHMTCLQLKSKPKRKNWTCPECRKIKSATK